MTRSVIVVGGGVIGGMAAYHLARTGWRVTILDRGPFGAGCSHGNCGYVCPSHALPLAVPGAVADSLKTFLHANSPLKLRPGAVLSRLGWFLNFARKCNRTAMMHAAAGISSLLNSSRSLFDEFLSTEQIACDWETRGLLFVFRTKAAFDHYAATGDLLRDEFQLPATRYDAKEIQTLEPALVPGAAAGGYLYASDGHLRSDLFMAELKRVLLAKGVEVVENCEVTGLRLEAGKAAAVTTVTGDRPAEAVVFATGAWTPKLNAVLGCKVPIVPGKGYSITTTRPKVCPTYPLIFEEHRVAVTPFASGYRIGSTMEFAGYDARMNRNRLQLLRDGAAAYLREPAGDTVLEEWWGWRPMVYDGNPIIDFVPAAPNAMIAAGHGMLGLSQATGTGKLVAELLNGEKPHIDPNAYSLKRFG
ncbi:MAG TPA: FAD-dependent oxidoreductase [Fimbriiglobus sp.]|jgi:D-amino-acid dehydrogenase